MKRLLQIAFGIYGELMSCELIEKLHRNKPDFVLDIRNREMQIKDHRLHAVIVIRNVEAGNRQSKVDRVEDAKRIHVIGKSLLVDAGALIENRDRPQLPSHIIAEFQLELLSFVIENGCGIKELKFVGAESIKMVIRESTNDMRHSPVNATRFFGCLF